MLLSWPAGSRADATRRAASKIVGASGSHFERITAVLKGQLQRQFDFRRINPNTDLVWRGPALPFFLRAGCRPYDQSFTADNLRYSEREQGRDALTEILGALVQTGMEQGRRLVASGARLARTEALLTRARQQTRSGDTAAALSSLVQAEASLPALPAQVRTARVRHAALTATPRGLDWPSSTALPVRPGELVAGVADVLAQAYEVKTKDGQPVSKRALHQALQLGLEIGIEQGKRHFMGDRATYGLEFARTLVTNAKYFFSADRGADPVLGDVRLQQLDDAINSIRAFRQGR
jgi:hypothetical protein